MLPQMKKNRRAFTLVEIMVATTILLMVVSAAMSVVVSVNRSMYGLSDAIDLNARTRLTQERILFDVRAITKVTQADSQSFTGEFVEYATGRTGELSYYFQGDKLLRRVTIAGEAAKTTTVMEGLRTAGDTATACRFLYRNRSGSKDVPAASAAEVRAIQFELIPLPTARQTAGLVTGRNDAFSSALVQLRNITS